MFRLYVRIAWSHIKEFFADECPVCGKPTGSTKDCPKCDEKNNLMQQW